MYYCQREASAFKWLECFGVRLQQCTRCVQVNSSGGSELVCLLFGVDSIGALVSGGYVCSGSSSVGCSHACCGVKLLLLDT